MILVLKSLLLMAVFSRCPYSDLCVPLVHLNYEVLPLY